MREIIDAIRKHPYVAQYSATGMLAGILGYFIGEFIVDPLRDLFFKSLGQRLGITDVTTLAHVVTALILIGIAAAIIWASFRLGAMAINSDGHDKGNRVGGDPLVTTGAVLPLQDASDRMIPLIEAATRSLERTEHTIIPAFDKMFDSSPDGRLGWHCNALWERAPIYGVEPPSRNIKEFPWAKWRGTYSMEVKNGVAFLQHRYEKTRIEGLQIRLADLDDAINKLLLIAGDENDRSQQMK